MQLTIDVKESALDKVMYLLNNLKDDVRIIDKKKSSLVASVMESQEDIKYGRVTKIENIDRHIEELDHATK